jgi:hypothetical protein
MLEKEEEENHLPFSLDPRLMPFDCCVNAPQLKEIPCRLRGLQEEAGRELVVPGNINTPVTNPAVTHLTHCLRALVFVCIYVA